MAARRLLIGAVSAAVLAAGTAIAAAPAANVITQPDWLQKPTGEDMAEHYPKAALAIGLEGRASLSCRVNTAGRLTGCEIMDETPKDIGFAQAALAMADSFQMKPMSVNGQPVEGGTVRIPIMFRLPASQEPAPPPAPTTPELRKSAELLVDALGLTDYAMREFDQKAHEIETAVEGAASGAARAAVAGAYRDALAAHRVDVREAYVRAYAAVFSEDEMAAAARFQTTYGKLLREPSLTGSQASIMADSIRAMQTAGHAAFCGKHDCGGSAAVQRVWRAADPKDDRIDIPQWDDTPESVSGPPLMAFLGITGVARLTCRVAEQGALTGCAVDEEAPKGLGYGAAALKLTDQYRLGRIQLEAGGVGRKVTVRVGFPPTAAATPWTAPKPRSEQALAIARQMVIDSGVVATTRVQTELQVADFESRVPAHADKAAYDDAIAAYRAAVAQGMATASEDTAKLWASTYTEDQLNAFEAFYKSPAGKAEMERQAELQIAAQHAFADLDTKITTDARRRYCASHDCTPLPPLGGPAAQPASGAKPEPSTRKP